ncbi:hypothetical protein [Streptomyces sp. MNP-20]|uniref:hypothetical protein n=1 Tax=Streptomyces sp. MNP-20 TaxID=2721165 RepID=UPI001557DC1C|nr:hypothetical protein [Streptomyces sp. MNP-20]
MAALATPPPGWTFGAVGTVAAMVNLSVGRRSAARWAAVGFRHWREKAVRRGVFARPGATTTWGLYPGHGTMQDGERREAFHQAFARALTFAAGQAKTVGIQVHVTHHKTAEEGYAKHEQTVSVHVPQGVVRHPERILATVEGEFAALGSLHPVKIRPLPEPIDRAGGWVGLDDGRYAATARITGWPEETDGDLMPSLLLDPDSSDRSLGVLYRPLPASQSRRSAKWQRAASEAFTLDKVKQDAEELSSGSTHGALVQGASLVDLDAYLTVWGESAQELDDNRWQTVLAADRHRIRLDWLTGQQHRAYAMTTPHAASTRKGTVL